MTEETSNSEVETNVEEAVVEAPKKEKKKGNKETKDVLALGFAFAKAYKAAKADGQVNSMDLPLLVSAFPALGPALEGIDQVPAELKDLDLEEVGDILAFSAAHLSESADSESLKRKVEKSLKLGLAVLDLVKEFK